MPSENYSEELLAFIGEAAIKGNQSFGNFDDAQVIAHQFTLQSLTNTQLLSDEYQAASISQKKKMYAALGQNFIGYLNKEADSKLIAGGKQKEIAENPDKLTDWVYTTLLRTLKNIFRKHTDLITDYPEAHQISETNEKPNITSLLEITNQLNSIDAKFKHFNFTLDLRSLGEYFPEERQWALLVIKDLIRINKINRIGALQLVAAFQSCDSSDAIIELTEQIVTQFYVNPLQELLLKIEKDIADKILNDAVVRQHFIYNDLAQPQSDDLINAFSYRLESLIYQWIKFLTAANNNNTIDKEKFKIYEQSLINYQAELVSWMQYLQFNGELKYLQTFLLDLHGEIFKVSTDNQILDLLELGINSIEFKNQLFDALAKIYITSKMLTKVIKSDEQYNDKRIFTQIGQWIELYEEIQATLNAVKPDINNLSINNLNSEANYTNLITIFKRTTAQLTGLVNGLKPTLSTITALKNEEIYETELIKLRELPDENAIKDYKVATRDDWITKFNNNIFVDFCTLLDRNTQTLVRMNETLMITFKQYFIEILKANNTQIPRNYPPHPVFQNTEIKPEAHDPKAMQQSENAPVKNFQA